MNADRSSRPWSVGRSAILLAAFVLGLALALSLYNGWRHGTAGVVAALVGVAICGSSSLLALIATVALHPVRENGATQSQLSAVGPLAGIAIRTGPPLIALVALPRTTPELSAAGVAGMILTCYLALLVAETLLAVGVISSRSAPVAGASAPPDHAP